MPDKDYDNLRNESYRTLLNSEIQANAAKEQALKYTQNTLNNQGYGNQGLSESARAGIYNAYANQKANAMNTYRNELLGINAQEKDEYGNNYDSLSELLDGTFTTDGNGNTTSFNIDAYKNILTNPYIGGVFDENNNLDLTNVKISDLDKARIAEQYKGLLNWQKENTTPNNVEVNNTDTFKTKANDVLYFKNDSGHNNNFNLTDSNGKTTEWEMGGLIKNYKNHIDVTQAESDSLTRANGDIWLNNKGNYYSLVIKDQNGKVRAFEGTSKSKKDFEAIASLFKRYGLGIDSISENAEDGNKTCYMRNENGDVYVARYDGDGYIYLEKDEYAKIKTKNYATWHKIA